MKRILLIATMMVALFASPVMASTPIRIMVDSSDILSHPGLMINGTVYVPLRDISEAMGASVQWFPQSQAVLVHASAEPVVDGDAIFKDTVAQAMALLKNQSPAGYKMVCNNVKEIAINTDSVAYRGITAEAFTDIAKRRICFTPDGIKSDYFVPEWVASVLVHESVHCAQVSAVSRKAIELEACSYQMAALETIGAQQKYIDTLKSTIKMWETFTQ